MNALNEEGPDGVCSKGHLLIVDDDPIAAGMLGVTLEGSGYEVMDVPSGEDCLMAMGEYFPEVVLLDIDMPGGMNGYETCQRIRDRFDRSNLTIIFLSAHDSLEERLHAYDAGGDDFVAKPFNAEEIRRKIVLAVSARLRRAQLVAEKSSLEESADMALQGFNEMGDILKFTRGALSCRSLKALCELMIASMASNQCMCHVQLRGSAAAGTLTMTPSGVASPLEESVIEHMRQHDRIFQFKSRLILNYGDVSLLITNMPMTDDGLAGRLRDYAAMVAEAAGDAVVNISLRADALAWAQELRQLGDSSRERIERLAESYRQQQTSTRLQLEGMAEKVEAMYYQFGLSDRQEAAISETVSSATNEVVELFDRYGEDFDRQFTCILGELDQASAFCIDTEEPDAAPVVELW